MRVLSRAVTSAFFLIVSGVAGCGVIYTPQEFSESSFTYGYKGDFDAQIEVVSMTFRAARIANSDNYIPKSLPEIFSETDPIADISTRERIAAAGLDDVTPALVFDPIPRSRPYDPTQEVLPPARRNESLSTARLPDASNFVGRRFDKPAPGSGAGRVGNNPSASTLDYSADIVPPAPRRRSLDNPLPRIDPTPYLIGPGDVIRLQLSLDSAQVLQNASAAAARTQQFLVQNDGSIFIPEVGDIDVEGMTLTDARNVISDRLVANQLGFDAGIEISKFGSKIIAVGGLDSAKIIPVTIRPTTLGEAAILTGGLGSNPADTIVRVVRDGAIYEMTGDQITGSTRLSGNILIDGDIVSILPTYDLETALKYFDQQLRIREFERVSSDDARKDRAENRAIERDALDSLRIDMDMERYRLEVERLRQQAQIAQLEVQRETDQINENARIANINARQDYLDRLRALQQANREELRQAQSETRSTLIANQAERARERAERRALLELELQEERLRLQRITSERQQARELFAERVRLGAVQPDYVTIAGETVQQLVMPMPFNGRLTLNRVLYEKTKGINLTSGDTSEIYVFRTPQQDSINEKLIAYHLNASNPAALAVASVFEMRPNDVVYVNPQVITKWNRVLTQILPSTGLVQSGISAISGTN